MCKATDDIQIPMLVDLLVRRASETPDQLAFGMLEFGPAEASAGTCRPCTYAELDWQARRIAAALRRRIGSGDRVLLLYPPGLDFLHAFFGCLYAGVVAVPAYPPRRNRRDARLPGLLADAGAEIALSTTTVLADRESWTAQMPELAALVWLTTDALDEVESAAPAPEASVPATIAFLQYTSGSTGSPKGVVVTHGTLLSTLEDLSRGFEHTPESVMVSWLPMFHDLGLIYGALVPVYAGFPSYFMAPAAFLQRPARWLEAISQYAGTHTAAPNFAFELCVSTIPSPPEVPLDLRSLVCALNAAETVRAETIVRFNEAFAGAGLDPAAIRPGYGLAEVTLKVSTVPLRAPLSLLRVSAAALRRERVEPLSQDSAEAAAVIVGCGISHCDGRIEIVTVDGNTRSPDGTVGEVCVSGPSVAHGYFGRVEESERTFCATIAGDPSGDRFLRTGDLGFVHAGELFICGRCKEIIIIRGLNYFPQDLELAVQQAHEALRPDFGAAFSIDEAGEERLVVVQEVRRTHLRHLNVEEIAAAARGAIAEAHQLPLAALLLVKPGTVPKTSSGKIQRRGAKAAFLAGEFDSIALWEAPAPVERRDAGSSGGVRRVQDWLLDFCSARFGVARERLSLAEPLTSYGMDSVAAVDLARELGKWLGRNVEAGAAFDYPSIGALAAEFGTETPAVVALAAEPRQTAGPAPIAIVGLGLRFPGAPNPTAFWDLLRNGRDAVSSMPRSRPGAEAFYTQAQETGFPQITRGGFLDEIDRFDASFFGISPREAEWLDPQHRLLLEVSWAALEDSGFPPDALAGSRTGVFIGASTNDYARLFPATPSAHAGTGNALSMAANRLSYFYDWRGPSLVLDTACSSSLVALHQACAALKLGECDLALAGGVNLILEPAWSVSFARAGMLSSDGKCKTFDAAADGYVRGEGCGIVALQRLDDALAAGNRVLAIVRGSAVNQDGRTNGVTAPNGLRQCDVLQQALSAAGITPDQVSYVETHGTGTQLGDPIEVEALRKVFAGNRALRMGSVKTNIGHLEAAAGMAGVAKSVLALRHAELPPHLHFHALNSNLGADSWPAIPTRVEPWPHAGRTRIAAVSSFGFGGTNACVVLEEAPAVAVPRDSTVAAPPLVLAFSAKSPAALQILAGQYASFFDGRTDLQPFLRGASVRRAPLDHRAAIVADSPERLRAALSDFAGSGEPGPHLKLGHAHRPPRLAFLFTGQGSLYTGVAADLYREEPVFREALDACAVELGPVLPVPLLSLLHDPSSTDSLRQTQFAQPALFALSYALVQLWKSRGIEPDAVLGHSVGEYAAACAAGVFDLKTGLQIMVERALQMQALPAGGAMAAVFAGPAQLEGILQDGAISIAALNGARETVISGPEAAIESVCRRAEALGLRTQRLAVSHAFHSALMEPMLAPFRQFLGTVGLRSPSIPLVSNLSGVCASDALATPEYWVEHVRQPVRYAEGLRELQRLGCEVFLEIGPEPILTSLARRELGATSADYIASLRRGRPDRMQMVEAAAALFVAGCRLDWRRVYGKAVESFDGLPSYPFQRQRYWLPEADGEPRHEAPEDEVPMSMRSLDGISREGRAGRLRGFVEDELRHALKLPADAALDPEQGFADMGLDSQMALHLRARIQSTLGLDLPATLAFAYSTVEELADHLAEISGTAGESPALAPPEEAPAVMDDAEVARLIAAKFNGLASAKT